MIRASHNELDARSLSEIVFYAKIAKCLIRLEILSDRMVLKYFIQKILSKFVKNCGFKMDFLGPTDFWFQVYILYIINSPMIIKIIIYRQQALSIIDIFSKSWQSTLAIHLEAAKSTKTLLDSTDFSSSKESESEPESEIFYSIKYCDTYM